ncbi:ATP12 family chaperone protein [Azospirillum halopraeferens]|uniref:ATP12 family chaperone protein n=1 Tax=Azospirillum halopraeferens TaxID=34010 RepID=UPI00041E471C|nr:ATP12 family protein [Azospirillum halopraeferens]
MKRFYTNVDVAAVDAGWEVRLDGRAVRSPAKAPLPFATPALARAVADEWAAQGDQVAPRTMPLMQLAATAVDVIGATREAVIADVARYAETDLLCYRAEHPRELVERQARVWQPLLDWAMLRYDAPLHVCAGLMPQPQPEAATRALRHAVAAHDDWMLAALQSATSACGSLVVALALLERRLDAAEAFDASQLDENYQIEQWGEDPEATTRRAGLRADIEAARRFADLLRTA